MLIRLLIATPGSASRSLFETLLGLALELTPLDVHAAYVDKRAQLCARAQEGIDDVIVLDWLLVNEQTPDLVRDLLQINPRLRVVVLLPLSYRQYRREVWQAGACSSIAREHMEQEWLSSVLCIMHRAMQRESRLLDALSAAGVVAPATPTAASRAGGCCDESATIESSFDGRKANEGSPDGKG